MNSIVICDECKGNGQVRYDVGSHKSEYEYSKCKKCKGSGRLEETTSVQHKPFVPGGVKARVMY